MFTDGTSESSTPTEEAAQPVSCIVKLKNETIEVKAEAPAGVLPNGTQMIVRPVQQTGSQDYRAASEPGQKPRRLPCLQRIFYRCRWQSG